MKKASPEKPYTGILTVDNMVFIVNVCGGLSCFQIKMEPVQNSIVDKCPYKRKKESMKMLSFFKTGIIVEK